MAGVDKPFDESRIIYGPGGLSVYVPPKPPRRPEHLRADWPQGEPPEVHYRGVSELYHRVLNECSMHVEDMVKRFSDEQMDWLRSIRPEIDKIQSQYQPSEPDDDRHH